MLAIAIVEFNFYIGMEIDYKWTRPLYLCENSYYVAFYFMVIIMMLGYIYTFARIHFNPQLILNAQWYAFQSKKQIALIFIFFLVVFNGFFISLYSLLAAGFMKFPQKKKARTKNLEKNLNLNYRGDEIINALLIIVFLIYFITIYRKRQSKISIANKLLKDIDKKAKKYGNGPEGVECAICMEIYTSDSSIIQLLCHQNHFYHKDCFKTFLEGMTSEDIGEPKCPLC